MHRQARLAGDPAHFGLREAGEREHDPRELRLGEPVEEVALVLGAVGAFHQLVATVGLPHARVVAGGDPGGAHCERVIEERLELDLGVAQDVGVRRAAGRVLGEKAREHAVLVLGREVDHLELDPEDIGDRGDVDQILPRRAIFVVVVVLPVLHEEPDDLVALLPQQQSGDRRVDPAGHADDDPFGDRTARALKRPGFALGAARRAHSPAARGRASTRGLAPFSHAWSGKTVAGSPGSRNQVSTTHSSVEPRSTIRAAQ